MEPKQITPLRNTPLNRLFFAINHYVSTGDHFGEGVGIPEFPGLVRVLIPVNRKMEQDRKDFETFKSKVEQLDVQGEFPIRLELVDRDGVFDYWSFVLPEFRMDDLAEELRRAPGPLGWGSGKSIIDKHNWI